MKSSLTGLTALVINSLGGMHTRTDEVISSTLKS